MTLTMTAARPIAIAAVAVDGVTKRYPTGIVALDGINLRVAPGEFVCLVGPSGCGKSTLLNIIAALEKPDSGQVLTD